MRKLISFILAICMVASMVGMLPVSVSAATYSGTCGNYVSWELDDNGNLTISGTGAMANYTDASNAPWYSYRSKITSVTIENGVTTVGDWAFYYCSKLASVTIPNSVVSIGKSAFYRCSGLTNITIPDSVTSVGDSAFRNCTALASVIIPDSLTAIGKSVFRACSSLTSINIPDSVASIGDYAFYGCSNLAEVYLGKGILNIDANAFSGCDKVENVYYAGGESEWANVVIATGNDCLTNATVVFASIASGTCGENVKWSLDNNGNLTISGTGAMANYTDASRAPWYSYRSKITSVTIENGVTTVGDWAFYYCSKLASVTIPDSVVSIGKSAFYRCSGLANVTIPDSVTSVGDSAFRNCTALASVIIPDSLTAIGKSVFRACSSLTSVTIPDSIASIGDYAFYDCNALTDVYYDGIKEAWDKVSIGGSNTPLSEATIHTKAVANVTIDGVSEGYATVADAIDAANAANKAVEVKLLLDLEAVEAVCDYVHTIDLNGFTVEELSVEGDAKLVNGSVTVLNVAGIVVAENVTVTSNDAISYGTEGTKSVYAPYGIGANVVEGAQVRIGKGLVDGKIDSESGLRFIGQADMNDTIAGVIITDYYAEGVYTDGYGVGIEIGAQDSENKAYIEATKWQDDANSVFSAAVTGLNANNFNRNYTARCYVEYDGVKIFEEGSTTRSMYTVASGLLINNKAATENLLKVLNAYVNQTGVRLTLTKSNELSARMSGSGAYTGEAFFTVGETTYEDGKYMVTLEAIGQARIDVDLFNTYVRINNNNSAVSPVTFITEEEDGVYTIVFDYASL